MNSNKYILLLFILCIANVVLYWPGNLYFLNDDLVHIPLTDDGVLFQQRSIRPVHELLVKLDLFLWQKNASGFHFTALLLHAIVTVQLFFLTKTIQLNLLHTNRDVARNTALLASCIFLVYPQNAESLAWILGRTPTLAAIFFIGMLQLYVRNATSRFTYFFAFVLFAICLFTYEQSILFPLVFFGIAFAAKQSSFKQKSMAFAWATTIAAVLYVIARKLITTEIVGAYEGGNFSKIVLLATNGFRLFFRLFLNPSTVQLFTISTIIFSVLLLIILWQHKKQLLHRHWLLFVFIMVIFIAPVLSLGVTVRSFESGRYLYFPAIFLSVTLAIYFQQQFIQKGKLTTALFILLFVYWGWGKIESAKAFKNASAYVRAVHDNIQQHFQTIPNDTLKIDTLQLTIHRLPVFRMGFKQGVHWLNNTIDTQKIQVKYYRDEFLEPEP